MKQKDIFTVIIVAVISGAISLTVSKTIFAPPANRQQKVEQVSAITADFPQPDERFFNKSAFDPTQPITISQNVNPDPFKETQKP